MSLDESYIVYGVSLQKIRNKNEIRVIDCMADIIEEYYDDTPDPIDIQDIFALALNKLPARYIQQGGFVLREPVSDDTIRDTVREAVDIVFSKPNY
ncbi:late competence development ComFB family protein [bacterium]|nr:late competence development ComFB family protein [Candidatus Neomarinimicrobiota bacterium]MCK5686281.1 late competence development ComFB family protein [bacterium]